MPGPVLVADLFSHAAVVGPEDRVATDGGPRYAETPADPAAASVAEPFNAATAGLFVAIAVAWLVRLRGRYAGHLFVAACQPILLVGGVGGTLYHAFRSNPVWLLMDVLPISVLGAAGSVYLTVRLGRSVGRWKVLAVSVGLVAAYVGVNALLMQVDVFPNRHLRINLSYASLAAIVLLPLAVVVVRTRFRDAGRVAAGLVCFGIAWFFRLADGTGLGDLTAFGHRAGTHWLWHLFGAATTWILTDYFYRLEGRSLGQP